MADKEKVASAYGAHEQVKKPGVLGSTPILTPYRIQSESGNQVTITLVDHSQGQDLVQKGSQRTERERGGTQRVQGTGAQDLSRLTVPVKSNNMLWKPASDKANYLGLPEEDSMQRNSLGNTSCHQGSNLGRDDISGSKLSDWS